MKRKRILLGILVTLAALIVLLVIFDRKATPAGKCRNGICVDVHIEEPIPYDQPVPVTVTVTTDRNISGLEIGIMTADPFIVIEGDYEPSIIDTQAGVPQELTITVRFTRKRLFMLNAYAIDYEGGFQVEKGLVFYMTASGGTFNIPDEPPTSAPPSIEAPTPTPLPSPTLKP